MRNLPALVVLLLTPLPIAQPLRDLTVPLAAPDLDQWGGKNDGQVHYPITCDTLFLLDNESREKSAGEIWIASPTLIE
jgi:hypothetical protein